jgi:hypothetical protein
MKFSTGLLTLLLPAMAIAQNYQGMSEQGMQNMMESMQEMQTCMQGIDQSRMDALEQRAKEMEAEVNSLCAKGRRDAAQIRAMTFSREMASDPDVQKMRKCGDGMKGMMPTMPMMGQVDKPEKSGGHICDE